MEVQAQYLQYRKFLAELEKNDSFRKLKATNFKIIQDRQLISWMSDMKWIKLQHAMQAFEFPPAYIAKLLTVEQDLVLEHNFKTQIPNYLGDWSAYYEEGMPLFFNIEYIWVKPLFSKFQGHLIGDSILDQSAAFRMILTELKLNFDEVDYCFKVYAYTSA